MRVILISAAAALSLAALPARAQVPVTDVASQFQLVKQNLQEALGYARQGQQYLTELQSAAQLVTQTQALIQNPSLGAAAGLMGRAGLSNDLPVNPYSMMSLTSGYSMSLSGLSGKLAALGNMANTSYGQSHVYDCSDSSWACQQQKQRAYGLAGSSGIAQAAYQNLRDHMPVVQALRDRAATATGPAERENVAIALQSEQAWHDNLMGQVKAAEMQAGVARDNLAQQDNEKTSQDIEATINQIPGG